MDYKHDILLKDFNGKTEVYQISYLYTNDYCDLQKVVVIGMKFGLRASFSTSPTPSQAGRLISG